MLNILVTGASGLIGHELCRKLSSENNVYAISRNSPKLDSVNFINLDLSKEFNFKILPKKIDVIYHLCQSYNFRNFPYSAIEVFNVNTSSTLKLLDYASKIGCKKFIYASSGGVYNESDISHVERSKIDLNHSHNFYSNTKLSSELILNSYSSLLDIVICRFFFVYGERQKKDMLIPRLVNNVIKNQAIILDGDQGIRINPIYFEDAVNALLKTQDLKGLNRINIAGAKIYSIKEICDKIGEISNTKPIYNFSNKESINILGNTNKLSSLDFISKVNLYTGIQKLVKSFEFGK